MNQHRFPGLLSKALGALGMRRRQASAQQPSKAHARATLSRPWAQARRERRERALRRQMGYSAHRTRQRKRRA